MTPPRYPSTRAEALARSETIYYNRKGRRLAVPPTYRTERQMGARDHTNGCLSVLAACVLLTMFAGACVFDLGRWAGWWGK